MVAIEVRHVGIEQDQRPQIILPIRPPRFGEMAARDNHAAANRAHDT